MEQTPQPGPDGWIGHRLRIRRQRRRAVKKRRLAAMTRKRRVWRRVGILGTWLLGFIAVLVVGSVIAFYSFSDVPRPETLPLPQSATIEFADGSQLAQIGSVNRTIVDISQVPKPVRYDILAAEDRSFYSEPGVSVTGTFRAALNDLTGGDTQGGSGITQQYVKNAYLTNSRTLTRKLRELAIAVKLSREYSKDKILEFYLNTVYFGRNSYGIEAGAQAFFGKSVSKLDVAQGAVLAAMLRAPGYYDPSVHPNEAKARWHYVIDGMVSTHHLTQAQADALTFPKVLPPSHDSRLGIDGPRQLIVQRVLAELAAHGISQDDVYTRGLVIKTTIDPIAQQAAEKAVSTTFGSLTKAQRNMKNALVAVDPHTGGVLAYYGGPYGKNYDGKVDYYDYAGLGSAAPGSSFKPYTLATALTQTLENKISGNPLLINSTVDGSYCSTIDGTQICNDPSDKPLSSSHVSVANAMKYSLNTTFDQMALRVGPPNVAATAHAMGVSKKINGKPTLVNSSGQTTFGIGIGDFAVHPIDQAVGFATLADGGITRPSYFVQKATLHDGSVVYQHANSDKRAIDAAVANDVTKTLEPIAAFSSVPLADGRPSAAKTGTEGIQSGPDKGGNSDAWMVGFTPQVSAAVWVGSGDATHAILSSSGGAEYGRDLPGKTWQAFMNAYLKGKPQDKLATKQLIFGPRGTPTPSTNSASLTTSSSSSSSSSPKPTFSVSSGFPSSASSRPTTSAPPTRSSPPTTSPPPSAPSSPSGPCGGLLQTACPSR